MLASKNLASGSPSGESPTDSGRTQMEKIKSYISLNYPTLYSALSNTKQAARKWMTNLSLKYKPSWVFFNIYTNNFWGGAESRSGRGSSLEQTKIIREQLPLLIKYLGVKSFLDAPCGDFYWMKEVNLDLELYIGGDIVEELIEHNRKVYTDQNRKFIILDITKDILPTADLIFSRDCLVHFSFQDIRRTIWNFKQSDATYVLMTTFTSVDRNIDIRTGEWRPLNFQLPPFNFPEPIRLINENCTEGDGRYPDKSLGLWKISDIPWLGRF